MWNATFKPDLKHNSLSRRGFQGFVAYTCSFPPSFREEGMRRNPKNVASEAIGTFTKSVNVKWWNWWDLSSVQFVYWFLVLYISICLLFVGFMTTFCRWLHLLFLMSLVPVEEKHPLQLHHPHLHQVTWTKLPPFCQYVSPELWNIYFVKQKCHDILFSRKKPS